MSSIVANKVGYKDGECEAALADSKCVNTVSKIRLRYGNMWMCDECWNKEEAVAERAKESTSILIVAKQIDSAIELKSDVYNAATVAAVEIKAAIEHDNSIPADQKGYAYTKACAERLAHMKKVMFEKREELIKDETIARMWLTEVQDSAAKLQAEHRAHFRNLDVNYKPVVVKPAKQTKGQSNKPLKMSELKELATKYGIAAAAIQSVAVSRGLSIQDAAVELATAMGKIK